MGAAAFCTVVVVVTTFVVTVVVVTTTDLLVSVSLSVVVSVVSTFVDSSMSTTDPGGPHSAAASPLGAEAVGFGDDTGCGPVCPAGSDVDSDRGLGDRPGERGDRLGEDGPVVLEGVPLLGVPIGERNSEALWR